MWGASVAAVELDETTLSATVAKLESAGAHNASLGGDVRLEADVERLFDEAEAQLGPVDLLVNTAFAARHDRPDELSLADWGLNLETTLTAPSCAPARRLAA